MDIGSSMEGLRSILGVAQPATQAAQNPQRSSAQQSGGLDADQVTFSAAGNSVAQTASAGDVRMEKVAGIQAALAAGTYSVPASAVASRLVDSMLGGGV